jgi:uncharacterized membrane protein
MNNDGAPVAPKRGSNIALIVSLCLNLIFLGVIAAGVFRAAMMHPPQTMAGQGLFAPRIVMEMVPSATDKIQIILDAHGNKMDELRFEAQSARRDARRTFIGHNFSQASFDQSLDRVKSADGALEAEVLKIMSETVAKLTPEERRAFVEKIKEHNHSWWRHLGMGHDH